MIKAKTRSYDKKFMLDMTKEFHAEIQTLARWKNVSLHSFIIEAIIYYVAVLKESKDGKV